MRYFKKIILVVIMSAFICLPVRAEMTLKELFFDESKPFHLKILDVIPDEGIVQIGDENAKYTIIEFMDYFCGYCKKVHPELLLIANMQNKGIDFHNALFEVEGNLNNVKLKQIIENLELNDAKLNIDMTKDEVNNVVRLSSFLANGSGARGTPTFFVNEELVVGYISIDRIKALLK